MTAPQWMGAMIGRTVTVTESDGSWYDATLVEVGPAGVTVTDVVRTQYRGLVPEEYLKPSKALWFLTYASGFQLKAAR